MPEATILALRQGAARRRTQTLHHYHNKSLTVFADSSLRRFCYAVVDERFDCSSCSASPARSLYDLWSPKAMEKESFANALDAVDLTFTVLFAMEMVMKLVAFGLWFEESKEPT